MEEAPGQTLSTSTKLAIERTRLAHERTLMAWVRTATSLISFGFSFYKFFEYLRDSGAPRSSATGPREFALAMIGIGLTAMVLATLGHRRSMRALRADYGALIPYSLATVVAGLVGILGITLLVAVLLRV